ncbi:MAG: DUF1887 family CARF protein [Nitrospirota bacterium]
MSRIHVCLVSDQPIPTLTTVLQLKPDGVILLKTSEMDEKAAFLMDILAAKKVKASSERIEAYDINDVIRVSESVIKKCSDCEVSLNITGGTKIGTLGTFQAFYTSGKPIYYVDTKSNRILKLFPEKEQAEYPINVTISIKDYLEAYGFQVTSHVKDDSYIYARKTLTHYLAHTVAHDEKIIASLNGRLHAYDSNSSLPISLALPGNHKLLSHITLLKGVTRRDDGSIEIQEYDALRYLKGIWFEEYVYLTAKDAGADEVWLNIEGRWLTKGKYQPKNEFDVMISKGNRLFYISCKTANPDRITEGDAEGVGRHYLYELDSLSDKALGLFGKKMLASARRIDDPAIRERAKVLGIDLIDGKNIIMLKDTLKQWLRK